MFEQTEDFAELIGITLGDGNLGRYPRCQYLRIYCKLTEEQYKKELGKLLARVFHKSPYQHDIPSRNVSYLEISKKGLDKILGIKLGHKIKNKVRVPKWIFTNKDYLISCLRGLFDTDGCCYVTGGKYKIINFRGAIEPLMDDVYSGLKFLGFHPYRRYRAVELGRQKEVKRFFEIVKPRNIRHYRHDKLG